jgi:hypothetical protein
MKKLMFALCALPFIAACWGKKAENSTESAPVEMAQPEDNEATTSEALSEMMTPESADSSDDEK